MFEVAEDDDIIMYDSENEQGPRTRPLKKKVNAGGSADVDSLQEGGSKRKGKAKDTGSNIDEFEDDANPEDNMDDEEVKEDDNAGDFGQRRSARARKGKNAEYDEAEFDMEEYGGEYKRGGLKRRMAQRKLDNGEGEGSGEERYGLRRKKRAKTDKDEQIQSSINN